MREMTPEQVAEALGITPKEVRQIERQALAKLRAAARAQHLEPDDFMADWTPPAAHYLPEEQYV